MFLAVALEWQQHSSSFTACDENRTVRCRSSLDHFHFHHLTADGTCDEKWLTNDPFADSLDKNAEKHLVWVRRGVSVWFKDPDIFYHHVQNDTNTHWTAVTRTNRPIPGMSTCSDGLSTTKRPLLKHRRTFMSQPSAAAGRRRPKACRRRPISHPDVWICVWGWGRGDSWDSGCNPKKDWN